MKLNEPIYTNTSIVIETYGQAISFYLMASYIYYNFPWWEPLMPDENYDKLCKVLKDMPDSVEHQHKHLLNADSLDAGTGFDIKDYPLIVQHAAILLGRKMEEKGL